MSSSEQIIDYITRHGRARAHELRKALGISSVAVHKQLRKLVSQGRLKKVGTPPLVLYVMSGVNGKNLIELERIKRKVRPILEKADVKKAALFGSYARGEQTETSDIDLLIDVPGYMSLFGFIDLEHKLTDTLKKKVDLVDASGIKPRLKPYIMKDQVVII